MAYVTLDLTASRRRVLTGAATLSLAALLLGGGFGPASAATAKSSQKSVDYQTHPKGGHGCNSCKDFVPQTSCKTVESPIQASGWCNKYAHS
jgi:anaerobic selenocysteine-containing dehydrogenase